MGQSQRFKDHAFLFSENTTFLFADFMTLLFSGYTMFSSNGTKLYEGFFANGKRDGFFIEYDPVKLNNIIRQIDFFINDTLQYSAKYNENGELIRK